MSDVGDDDGKESDWIREVSDDSDNENTGGLSRKYYSQYIASSERDAQHDEDGEPMQWTGCETGLKKEESPIISNMDHYHVGPEFEENCQPWMTGEAGPGARGEAQRSPPEEVDRNENHLINIDFRGGEAFCDSDILSSDQSLSDFEQAENRWSSSESGRRRKNDDSHQRIVQKTECSVPRPSMPVFSRSAETAQTKLDQKQSAQRPDRFYAHRLEIRRRRSPSDQCIGEKVGGGGMAKRRFQIKGSKSCTTECEILRPGAEKLYPCPDKTRFSSLYEEILRSDELSFFTEDEDDNPEEDYSDFGDDGPVSEITGLETSDSKSERVNASRISARTESPGESLRDGAVPGGKDNSAPVDELSPLRVDEPPQLSPRLAVSAPITEKFHAETNAGDSQDEFCSKGVDLETTEQLSKYIHQTASSHETLDNKMESLHIQETFPNERNGNQTTASVVTCLENNGSFNFLNKILESAYFQTISRSEDSYEMESVETNGCISEADVQCITQPDSTDRDSQLDLFQNLVNNELTITKEMNQEDGDVTHSTVEWTQGDEKSVNVMGKEIDNAIETADANVPTGLVITQDDPSAVTVSPSIEKLLNLDAGEGSNDMNGDAEAPNADVPSCLEGAVENPNTPTPRQYYMSFLTVLRNKKLVNKKVRRPPQKFFRLLQAKSETMNLSEKDQGAADGRDASGSKEKSCKMQARHFPKGREVPPGWKPGQYTTSTLSGSAAPVTEHAAKKRNKKVSGGKNKQHAKGFNNNKRRQVSSEASVLEEGSEESFPARNRRSSYSSESSDSTESKHTLGYGERYNPHSEDYSETEQKGGCNSSSSKKSFGQEFESKRQYYEKLTNNKRRTSQEDEHGKVELTSQVKFLKTIDEFCSAEDIENIDYDSYEDTCSGPSEKQAMDSVEYHISLAKYYSGRASNLQAIKSNPPGEPSASCSGVRIRRATNSVPSALDNERLKSLSVEQSDKIQRERVGMWSLNTLYAHKIGISEVPRESSVSLVAPFAEGKDETVEVSQPAVRKTKAKHGRKRPLDRYRELKLAKFRSVKTSHLEKLAVFESERKVTYLDLLKTGYSSKMNKSFKDQDERKDMANVQKSKSCDNPGGKTSQGQIKVELSPTMEQESPRRLKLVRFNDLKPLEDDKPSEPVDRSEEDTWCYSVNAMLLKANQALEQQKLAIAENNHHFPRPDSAKVVPPVIKPKSSSFLSELLEQDREEQKKVKQKSRRVETPRGAEDERKRSVDNNGNAAENKLATVTILACANDYREVKPSCAFTNILPSVNLAASEAPESPKYSAGILKIKTSASSKKPKDSQLRREQKVFPSDCPASLYFSSNSSQPTVPPKKLLPLRYSAPVDATTHTDDTWTPVRILKQSMLQRGSNDIQDSPSQHNGGKQVVGKSSATSSGGGGLLSGLRYNRTDHRVSTIVQMFSDFNANNSNNNLKEDFADSDGYSHDSYVDPVNSFEDIESHDEEEDDPIELPYAGRLHHRDYNLQSIQEEPHQGSSSCYTSGQLETESDSSTNCSVSSGGLQHGRKKDACLYPVRYDEEFGIQSAGEESLDESVVNDLNLTYGVSNDPDALCIQGVMDILGKRHGRDYSHRDVQQHDAHFTSDCCSSDLRLSFQKEPGDHSLNVEGLDSREFITAALECSPGQAASRCVLRRGEMIEYCQPDSTSLTVSDRHHDLSSLDRSYSGVWDPNYPEEVSLFTERRTAKNGRNVLYSADKSKDVAYHNDCSSISEAEHEENCDLITPQPENSNYSKPLNWDQQRLKDSFHSSIYSMCTQESETNCPEKPTTAIEISFPARTFSAESKYNDCKSKKQAAKMTLKSHQYQFKLSDSGIKTESTASRGMLDVAEEQSAKETASFGEDQAGEAQNCYAERLYGGFSSIERDQMAPTQQEFDWGELKVPPPYPDRRDHYGERATARADNTNARNSYSDYSTPTQSRETLTDSEQFPSTPPEHCRSQHEARSSAAQISQDSHTTEIIGESYPGVFDQDPTMRMRDSRAELATASQVSELVGEDCVAAGHEGQRRGEQIWDQHGNRKYNPRSKLALTVINSSCLVYKRVNMDTPRKSNLQGRHLYLDRQYLKNLRGSDLLRTVIQDNQKLWPSLKSLVRGVTFLPAFQIRSLHPPEMIPVVIQVNRCGTETTDDVDTSDGAKSLPAFLIRDQGNLLQSLFSVYYLRPGLYSVKCTDGDEQSLKTPNSQGVLAPGRLSMYKAGAKITLDTSKDMYLFGDETSTYDLALQSIVETYDHAKAEKDAGVYFKLTCGWAPKYVVIGETVLETLNSFCLNCIRVRGGAAADELDARSEGSTDTRITQDCKMYHNFCDRCGGCIAAMPLMKNKERDLDVQRNGWTVDHSGKAIPLNTKPAVVKRVSTSSNTLPRLLPRRFYNARNRAKEVICRRGQGQQWMSFSLPSVVSPNAAAMLRNYDALASKPTQSVSSPNMYAEEWWWKEIEQMRQDEMESFKKDNIRGHSSDVELVSYNDEARSKRKQRLQEIKEELRVQRRSPLSEIKDILADERVPPPSLVEEFAPVGNLSANDLVLAGGSDLELHSVKSGNVGEDDKPVSMKEIPVPPAIKTREDHPCAARQSFYFGDVCSVTKANLVRNYVAPPSRLSSEVRANKLAIAKYPYPKKPTRLPQVSAEPKRGMANRKQQKSSALFLRPCRMSRAQKGKSKKMRVGKSTSLSSAESDLSDKTSSISVSSSSSSSVSDDDSSSGDTDFFTKYKKMGGPTSIDDIFTRTLPKLRAEQLGPGRRTWGSLRAGNAFEIDDDMYSWADRLRMLGDGGDEQGDMTGVPTSDHSHDDSAHSEYDMCEDADEMRQLWKLCFPEVNFFERRKKPKRLRQARPLLV